MTRNIFHRDFNGLKAACLAALIALACLMGEVPHPMTDSAARQQSTPERILPAAVIEDAACAQACAGITL
ncbi:hypothetical protein [Tropicibacter oceani]|uniref:Uncharacterized protein n=1 Tax=Tropicibacter oceani TaxID=3058420 RepID=A0ABY8QDK3_9RHOB|nr:hypothetical protein [Tropicibacter oceani]WGW02711.1 hypothetical protein QF118_12265 [Tropicibacter oceani]